MIWSHKVIVVQAYRYPFKRKCYVCPVFSFKHTTLHRTWFSEPLIHQTCIKVIKVIFFLKSIHLLTQTNIILSLISSCKIEMRVSHTSNDNKIQIFFVQEFMLTYVCLHFQHIFLKAHQKITIDCCRSSFFSQHYKLFKYRKCWILHILGIKNMAV